MAKVSNNQKSGLRAGFTLIEMLVVLCIVAILAILAIGSYATARQQARLDLSVDSFVSLLKGQAGKAKSGQSFSTDQAQPQQNVAGCFGVTFDKKAVTHQGNNTAYPVWIVSMPYLAVSGTDADVCDFNNAQYKAADTYPDLQLSTLSVDAGPSSDGVMIVFKPPFGKAVLANNESHLAPFKSLQVTFSLGTDASMQRSFQADGVTNEVRRVTLQPNP